MLDGAQAQYVRVPLADSTVMKAPQNIPEQHLVLMADIFPTGYYGVSSAVSMSPAVDISQSTMVVIGCGPVGLCAVVAALNHKPKHLFAIDSVDSRLEIAKKLGAEPLNFTDKDSMMARIKEATDGRGADMVVEVVGLSPALKTAFDIVRPFGVISSIGVHSAEVGNMAELSDYSVLTSYRSHGLPLMDMSKWCSMNMLATALANADLVVARIFGCRWDDALCAKSSPSRLSCWRRSTICLSRWRGSLRNSLDTNGYAASCSTRSCRSPRPQRLTTCSTRGKRRRLSSHPEKKSSASILTRLDYALMHKIVDNCRVVMNGSEDNALRSRADVLDVVKKSRKVLERPALGYMRSEKPFVLGILKQALACQLLMLQGLDLIVRMCVEAFRWETADKRAAARHRVNFDFSAVMLVFQVAHNIEGQFLDGLGKCCDIHGDVACRRAWA